MPQKLASTDSDQDNSRNHRVLPAALNAELPAILPYISRNVWFPAVLLASSTLWSCTATDVSDFVFSSQSTPDAGTVRDAAPSTLGNAELNAQESALGNAQSDSGAVSACNEALCLNGSKCSHNSPESACKCLSGYEGPECSTNVDNCDTSVTCDNGGVCLNEVEAPVCRCPFGFSGATCGQTVSSCEDAPCLNNGVCNAPSETDGGISASYSCQCPAGFAGIHCEVNVDNCHESPCGSNGTCLDAVDAFECVCPAGFTGATCETNINECLPQGVCENGGSCSDAVNGFNCQCSSGFEGKTCEQDIDECGATPCANGSECTNAEGSFSCNCSAGFEGPLCETNTDDCANSPCKNEALCKDGVDSFVCACPLGFAGTLCQQFVDTCADQPCQNNSSCEDRPPLVFCDCPSGFTGNLCELNVDDCVGFRCFNGAACIDGINEASCDCQPGFSGPRCATNDNDCQSNSCFNGGQCIDGVNSFSCNCTDGFDGSRCQLNTDDCFANACSGRGTCIDGVDSFQCECENGFEGSRCFTNTDDCQTDFCLNNGICRDEIQGFNCDCGGTGFTGTTCEIPLLQADGTECTLGTECLNGNCIESLADTAISICCTDECDPNVACQVRANAPTACVDSLTQAGKSCVNDTECQSSQCTTFFVDTDNDGFAAEGADSEQLCSGAELPLGFTATAPLLDDIDCSDSDDRANPLAVQPQTAGISGNGNFDYNCDGTIELLAAVFDLTACTDQTSAAGCELISSGLDPAIGEVPCGSSGAEVTCTIDGFGGCNRATTGQQVPQLCL